MASQRKRNEHFQVGCERCLEQDFSLEKIYLPKIIGDATGTVYIIGGADDLKITNALNSHMKLTQNKETGNFELTDLPTLSNPRASCGCCIS